MAARQWLSGLMLGSRRMAWYRMSPDGAFRPVPEFEEHLDVIVAADGSGHCLNFAQGCAAGIY
jgi:hypothetical protein